jgi:phosphate acetyltransferase
VDGVVAGAEYTTAAVLRSALTLIGRASGVGSVSGAFYMILPPFRNEGEEVLTFADCAVIREPTAEQLAGIAVSAAHDRRRIVGDEPVVALLSYSTRGSAGGRSVEVVREALQLIRIADAGLMVDGEMQADAALTRDVAHRKAPGSVVGGRANVLIFPSLDAGNIAYKLVQRIAGAGAVGPILQGLARPCNDLSRGSTSNDIINVAAVTVLQGADPS